MKRIAQWLACIIALAGSGASSTLDAQSDLARLCPFRRPLAVGQWASFRFTRGWRRDAHVRLAIVDSIRHRDNTAYVLEVGYGRAADDSNSRIGQMLVPDTTMPVLEGRGMATKGNSLPAVLAMDQTLQAIMRQIRGEAALPTVEACSGGQVVGWETVDVPAGTFHALHIKEANGEIWLTDSVPFGVVRAVNAEEEMVLTGRGVDAKPSIGEAPIPIPPWIPSEAVPLDSEQRVQMVKATCDSLVHYDLIRPDSNPNIPLVIWSRLWRAGLGHSIEQRPHLISGAPKYPKELRRHGVEGRVVLQGIVDTTGRVEPRSLSIVSMPYSALGPPAQQFVERAHFAPGRICGRPVRVLIQIPVEYKITPRGSK